MSSRSASRAAAPRDVFQRIRARVPRRRPGGVGGGDARGWLSAAGRAARQPMTAPSRRSPDGARTTALRAISLPIAASLPSTTARLIRFSSSRTLPGHVVVHQLTPASRATARCSACGRAPVTLEEVVGQRRNLLPAIAQRRQVDAHDVQPEVQVFAELAVGDGAIQIAVGGGEHARRRLARRACRRAARELAVLQHLQQLGLQRRRQIANLVEEERPLIGELEFARLVLDGAGEGAALEAEQLGFEQLRRQRRAVHLDERACRAASERP